MLVSQETLIYDSTPPPTRINNDRCSLIPHSTWAGSSRATHPHTHINDDRGSPIVHGLGAIGPEVGALGQVNVAGAKTGEEGTSTQ